MRVKVQVEGHDAPDVPCLGIIGTIGIGIRVGKSQSISRRT